MRCFSGVLAAILLVAPAAAHDATHDRPSLRNARLSLISVQYGEGEPVVSEVQADGVIPYRVQDSCYGWRLTFAARDRQFNLEELLLIPGAASEWGDEGKTVVADDRMSSLTPLVVSGHTGVASHQWCVAEGDPEGLYKFVISNDGKVVGKFTFHVLRQ